MKLNDSLKINNKEYKIKEEEAHSNIDFGVIELETPVTDFFNKDIALRNSALLEKIIIAGFPIIPQRITNGDCIVQSGEIASHMDSYNKQLELFTAIARPGNSGGPIMSLDGKLLGIVTESLEGEVLVNDKNQSIFPGFASIPSDVIFEKFQELKIAKTHSLPWENYQ